MFYVSACPKPSSISNGIYSPRSQIYLPGSQVIYSCDQNYQLLGDYLNECLNDGTWSLTDVNIQTKCMQSKISNILIFLHFNTLFLV